MKFLQILLYTMWLLLAILLLTVAGVALAYFVDISKHNSSILRIFEFVGVFVGVIVSAFVTMYVFWKGKQVEIVSENDRLNQLERYVKNSIKDLAKPMEQQMVSLTDSIKKLGDSKGQSYSPEYLANLHTRRIRWINGAELYKLFIERKLGDEKSKGDLFREFEAHCDYIDAVVGDIKNHFSYYRTKYEMYEQKWNESFVRIRDIFDRLMVEFEFKRGVNPQHNYPFLIEFDKLMFAWSQIENYTEPAIAVEKFLKPLQNICRATKGDFNAVAILQTADNCLHTFDNLTELRTFIANNFQFILDRLTKAHQRLPIILEEYDNKFKTIELERKPFLSFIVRRQI